MSSSQQSTSRPGQQEQSPQEQYRPRRYPSTYLTVPDYSSTRPSSRSTSEPPRILIANPTSGAIPIRGRQQSDSRVYVPVLRSQPIEDDPPDLFQFEPVHLGFPLSLFSARNMSIYSVSSNESVYSPPTPGPRSPRVVTPGMMTDPTSMRSVSQGFVYEDKDQLVESLRTRRVNTLTELRRIEKVFAYIGAHDVTEPMTSAWTYYVNSHNLLNELRGLTRNYPFSSDCIEEAKYLVLQDPASTRTWNYCWLVLVKIQNEQLIHKHAHAMARRPEMWGGQHPSAESVQQLANNCISEWTWAIGQLLRHWDSPPTVTGD